MTLGLSCRLCGVSLRFGFRFYKCVGGVGFADLWTVRGLPPLLGLRVCH